ncbi:hypothetical protein PRIPAC_72416, partial [Pristionchus pacificus]|uniref:Uncharacterized protein n=1 Tax=Pristionchus pacificus TaxID=54126 RepID=A0A2A6CG21_PRIPA
FNNGLLKCKDSKQIVIEGYNMQYDELKCDTQRNSWVHGLTALILTANEELNIKCEVKRETNVACDISNIKGVTLRLKMPQAELMATSLCSLCHAGIEFIHGKLKCKDDKPIAVDATRDRYDELTCDIKKGWMNGKMLINKEAIQNLNIECKAKRHIRNRSSWKICSKMFGSKISHMKPYDTVEKKLECKQSFEVIRSYDDESYDDEPSTSKTLTCDPSGNWTADGYNPTIISAASHIYVKCEVIACHKDLISGTADTSERDELKCDANKVLQIQGDSHFYKALKCSDGKWFDPSDAAKVQVKEATEQFMIDCILEPCTFEATGITFDNTTMKLTCHPGVIEFDENSYNSLTCDTKVGWSDEGGLVVAPAEYKLFVNCKHFCTTNADVEYKMSSDGSYNVKFKEFAVMLYDDGTEKKEVKNMTCSIRDGWKRDGFAIGKPSNSPLEKLSCRKSCDMHQKRTDVSDADKWEDGLTDSAEKKKLSHDGFRIECKNNRFGGHKSLMKLNGKFVYSHLNCNERGYTDKYGTYLADRFDPVKIECVDALCKIPSAKSLCNSIDHMPEYECDSADYFYFYGDANQEKIPNINHLLCVRKHCTTCSKLAKRGAGIGVDNYSPGTPEKCAMDTCSYVLQCPNNLWMVKRATKMLDMPISLSTVEHSEEQYVGEVTCSSKGNKEWIINADSDNPTLIVEGYCISSVECTKTVKLQTKCQSFWETIHGCKPRYLNDLNDNDHVTCNDFKNMFYKEQGAEYFEEGAESIKCDKMKGVWTVTKKGGNDELRK